MLDVGRLEVARQALDSMRAIQSRSPELDSGRLERLSELIERAANSQEPS